MLMRRSKSKGEFKWRIIIVNSLNDPRERASSSIRRVYFSSTAVETR